MRRFYHYVIRLRSIIMAVFIVLTIICAMVKPLIQVDYDMNDYLPEDTASTVALKKMKKEFTGAIPNARVMIKHVSQSEALQYKAKLEKIKGVESVMWLDDYLQNSTIPVDMYPSSMRESYYKNDNALFTVTIDEDQENETVDRIYKLIGTKGCLSGSAVSTAVATKSTVSQIKIITVIAIVFLIVILTITTNSWLEPLIVLIGLLVAIIINAGSNIIFGKISFVTNAAGNILQLAVSLDYSVFLIHRFEECRQNSEPKEAMEKALYFSTSSILSSGLTTVIGFLALVLMQFKIGPDLGLALAKGVAISLLTVFLFMPGLILSSYKLLEKSEHRSFLPSFKGLGRQIVKITKPLCLVFVLAIVPCYMMSNHNSYYFGSSHIFSKGTRLGNDTAAIEKTFGKNDTYVLMVPVGDQAKENMLLKELEKEKAISSVLSTTSLLGPSLPDFLLPKTLQKKLVSDHYERMIISVKADYEGEKTFKLVKKIRRLSHKYYGSKYNLAGQGVSTYDLMDTITKDMAVVNLIAIGAVFIVLVLTLRSILLPVVLVAAIETAIFINLSIPFLAHRSVFYIAYLIISSVQLGATVDYAILWTERYRENRTAKLSVQESIVQTCSDTTGSLLASGTMLTVVGFLLGIISTHGLLSQLGYLLGVGTLCSLVIVMFVLPGLLTLVDRWIIKG